MTVKELIEFLQKQPQFLPVVYMAYSEFCLLTDNDIDIRDLGMPREDGWVHDHREDKPTQQYLVFPGN